MNPVQTKDLIRINLKVYESCPDKRCHFEKLYKPTQNLRQKVFNEFCSDIVCPDTVAKLHIERMEWS